MAAGRDPNSVLIIKGGHQSDRTFQDPWNQLALAHIVTVCQKAERQLEP